MPFVPCTLYLGCVSPLLEVALRKFFPFLSVFCSSRPCCSLPLHDVIFPSHFGSAPRSSSFPHLPLCCAYCPPIVLHSCHMSSPSPFCIRRVLYDVEYIGLMWPKYDSFCFLIRFKSCGAFTPSCSRTLAFVFLSVHEILSIFR